MKGLSTTAIGLRSLPEALQIYGQLKGELDLNYLELAVGVKNDLAEIPHDIPLVIHDRALYEGHCRIPFSLMDRSTWPKYRELLRDRNVLGLSIHPPLKREASIDQVVEARQQLETFLGIPVALEVMPSPEYHLSRLEEIPLSLPILVDVSHVNIWAKNNTVDQQAQVYVLMSHCNTKMIHLSHNHGRRDSHDLIPEGIWFMKQDWGDRLVTYESLPESWRQFERLDKRRNALHLKNDNN